MKDRIEKSFMKTGWYEKIQKKWRNLRLQDHEDLAQK